MDGQSEVIPDETLQVVVHFSSSEDTICTLQLEDEEVFYWQIPDFMTDSLFVDFLTEIVDTISDRDKDRFIELFDPFSSLWDELRRWNKKRVKWFDSKDTCSKVRETCTHETSIGEFIFPFPSQGDIKSVDVRINDEIDPSGELRSIINQLIASTKLIADAESDADEETEEGLDAFVDDKYLSDEEEEIDEEVRANPEKPCYYPSQIEMAAILKKRIDTIMFHYHNITSLSDVFNDVEFVVYTARYRMLSDQTEKRIRHPDAGVLSKEELKSRDDPDAKKRMFMYVRSLETDDHFENLKRGVREKPNTLFVVIADECHWGITKDKDQKSSAHNLFINEWCKGNSPQNVVVVQISATPFNLLTQNSRLPVVPCVLLNDKVSTTERDYEEGDLVVLEREPDLEEHVRNNSKEVELHVVHWSEVELKNFEGGMRMKLKSSLNLPDARYQYLHVSSLKDKLGVTSNESEATEFVVQGSRGIVILKVMATNGQDLAKPLTITADEHGNLIAKADPLQPTTFEVKLDFGVGILAFSSCKNPDHFIAVDEHECVTLQSANIERKCGVCIMKPKHKLARVAFEFYMDQSGPMEVGIVGQQYMSLNYYLSTINYSDRSEQKIREDEFFQGVVDQAKRQKKISKSDKDSSSFPPDALLCAEYCYHILHASVYGSEEKIRQAFNPDSDDSPAANLERTLNSFTMELTKKAATSRKYINPDAFEFVRTELRKKVKSSFKESLKGVARCHKKEASTKKWKELKEVMATSFVACLMHLSQLELRKLKEDTHPVGIVEDIEQRLQENGCQEMIENWNHVVQEFETSSLTKNLIQSGKGERGKMKIVRAKSMETADQFFFTLRLARTVSSLDKCFEVIKDYGGIQIEKQLMKSSSPFFRKLQPEKCTFEFPDCPCPGLKLQAGRKKCVNCQHVHKLITQYEDLENLACVLILVDKGRMGDTFPRSFDCLDLRLSYDNSREFKEGTPLFLSTLIQELGRMCRYAGVPINDNQVQSIPYVLTGRQLFKKLKTSVEMSPSMSSISCTRADRYMTKTRRKKDATSSSLRWIDYEAHKDSYDHQNDLKHPNRILLQAEPQIGKTGTYLCLIKDLRMDILGKEKVPSTSTAALDEGAFYCHTDCNSAEEFLANDNNQVQDWEVPYWKTIQFSLSLYEKPVVPGKYSIGGQFYTHVTQENPYILMKREAQNPTKSTYHYQKTDCKEDVLRAWHWYHFQNCVGCGRLLQGKESVLEENLEINIDGITVSIKCSLPSSRPPYSHLLQYLKNPRSTNGAFAGVEWPEAAANSPTLPYWIFHPSHRDDPRKCTLNYHHVMQEKGKVASYVQAVVVRSGKFEAYRSTWGKVLAIFQLPESLPNCEFGPSEGGVGYARLFIQKLAFSLNLEYVFVIDDNVAVMSEAVLAADRQTASDELVARDGNGLMKMESCSFYKPFTNLQKITEGKDTPPHSLEPYPFKEPMDAQQFPLYSYSGPAKLFGDKLHESYGVLGLLRSIPRAVSPFAKTQVYAATLLNVKSTVEKGVFYRPWPCWEDLRFNDDCDKAGLWVVKCNRYHFLKVQHNDWINNLVLPNIFKWKDNCALEDRPGVSELPKDLEEGIILEHLRNFVNIQGPDKCFKGCIGYDRQEDIEEPVSPARIVQQVEAKEGTEEAFANGTPVLILSYCVTNSDRKNLNLLDSTFCSTKEKIVFVTSAKEVMEEWTQMTLTTIPTKKGICFCSEMRDRNAQFAIYSAADPRKHCLRYILIEASFSQDKVANEEALNSIKEDIAAENNQVHDSNVKESTLFQPVQHTDNETKGAKREDVTAENNQVHASNVEESTLSQPVKHRDNKTKGTKRSLEESTNDPVKNKKRKIKDGSSRKKKGLPTAGAGEVSIGPNTTKRDKEGHESQLNTVEKGKDVPGISDNRGKGCSRETSQADREIQGQSKVKRMKTEPVQDMVERNNEDKKEFLIKGQGIVSVAHREENLRKATSNNYSKASASDLQTMLGSEKRDGQMKKVETKTEGSKGSSVGEIRDEEEASKNKKANKNMLHAEDKKDERAVWQVDDDSNASTVSDSQEASGGKSKSRKSTTKTDLNISANMEGTNRVTGIIVDLWREYKEILGYSKAQIEERGSNDLSTDEVYNKLSHLTFNELQAADKNGYTALLKACSLPSMSPHVMQYLITTRKVDLNCQLSHDFDTNHPTARKLVPGMFALSVAIRGGNVKLVPTFMTRPGDINVRSKDYNGNTALHHCVLSHSKSSFQKLFPLYKPLEWKEMRNNELKNPLDICVAEIELMEGRKEKEKALTTLSYMRQEMEKVSDEC
ncbi:uncharacterized protein LOC144650730 [Oculina patagonica]